MGVLLIAFFHQMKRILHQVELVMHNLNITIHIAPLPDLAQGRPQIVVQAVQGLHIGRDFYGPRGPAVKKCGNYPVDVP